jgi:hypothetical protein
VDKGFQQCDWWRVKICSLSLHTKDQRPKDNTLQIIYMVAFFMNFGAKNLCGGRKFVHNIYGNPNSLEIDNFFFPNVYKLHNLYILTPKIPCVFLTKLCSF